MCMVCVGYVVVGMFGSAMGVCVGVCVYVILCEMCDCLLWDVFGDVKVGLRVEGWFVCKV